MENTFILKIRLGNDAMQAADDIAEALRATATKIEVQHDRLDAANYGYKIYGYVVDKNGNNVGSWEISVGSWEISDD